jgi:hypothetical protein
MGRFKTLGKARTRRMASDKQIDFLCQLCGQTGEPYPEGELTAREASAHIDRLLALRDETENHDPPDLLDFFTRF